MRAKVTTKLGGVEYVFDIEEDKEIEVLHRVAALGNPPTVCDECGVEGADNFILKSNKDKEANVYVNVHCNNCGADAKLGLYKAGGFFWHDFKKYVPGQ